MIKRILCILCALIICTGSVVSANEDTPLCSLTISYTAEVKAFADLEADIYRVAEITADGEYSLLEPFSTYPININGITSQTEWQETAQTIRNLVSSDNIPSTQSAVTDKSGNASFSGLQQGLYLVRGITADTEDKTYEFRDFMIVLPTPSESGLIYDVEAKPKYTEYTPPDKYTVIKLWKDSLNSSLRPDEIHVDIIKDGQLWKNVILDSTNNWSYSWEDTSRNGEWSVTERDVPDGYTVCISQNETVFVITNSFSEETPDNPGEDIPATGETTPLLLYILIFFISGTGLVLLSILKFKEEKYEKEH